MEELIIQAKNGDVQAFTKLFGNIQDDLKKFIRYKVNNIDDINDIVQNAIIKAYLNIYKLENIKYFRTWIIRIVINECNNFYLYRKKDENLIERYIKSYENIEKEFNFEFDFDNIIEILSQKEQKIFKLFYQQDYCIKDIAKKLSIKESTIRAILSKGRKIIMKTQLANRMI